MTERTRLQLRLQSTVEGLSVAAISYYVVALFDHLAKAAHGAGALGIEPSYATVAFVPLGCWRSGGSYGAFAADILPEQSETAVPHQSHASCSRLACGQRSSELQDSNGPVGRFFRTKFLRDKLSDQALELGWQGLPQQRVIIGVQPRAGYGACGAPVSAMVQN
jgi:hypothetical protein